MIMNKGRMCGNLYLLHFMSPTSAGFIWSHVSTSCAVYLYAGSYVNPLSKLRYSLIRSVAFGQEEN